MRVVEFYIMFEVGSIQCYGMVYGGGRGCQISEKKTLHNFLMALTKITAFFYINIYPHQHSHSKHRSQAPSK